MSLACQDQPLMAGCGSCAELRISKPFSGNVSQVLKVYAVICKNLSIVGGINIYQNLKKVLPSPLIATDPEGRQHNWFNPYHEGYFEDTRDDDIMSRHLPL